MDRTGLKIVRSDYSRLRPALSYAARTRTKAGAVLGALALLLAGCAEPQPAPPAGQEGDRLAPQVASYDLAVGTQRFTLGLLTQEAELVGGGEVNFKFAYLGTRTEQVAGEVVAESAAAFLPIPPDANAPTPAVPDSPSVLAGPLSTGVYSTEATFDRAGFWGVLVEAEMQGEVWTGRTTFEVYEQHRFPAVGDQAPRSENLTIHSEGVPPTAVDSRAREGQQIPAPELHSLTVAESIASGTPTLVVISTPTYCVSRFCGPITDMVQALAGDFTGTVNFIHIEVWRDFEAQQVNEAAAEWVLRDQALLEPWVFLIGGDGTIVERWDNVATRGEIEPALNALS